MPLIAQLLEDKSLPQQVINTTGANLLVAAISSFLAEGSPTLTDSKGNVWTVVREVNSGNNILKVFCCVNPVVGSNHSFNYSGEYSALSVTAWSEIDTATAYDVANSAGANSVTQISSGAITPSGASLILSFCSTNGISNVQAATPATFSSIHQRPTAGNFGIFTASKFSGSQSINPVWNLTQATNANSITVAFRLKSPVANFTLPSEIITGQSFQATNTSTGTIQSYLWELGGQTVGTSANLNLNLAPGNYSLKLTVFDQFGGTNAKTVNFTVLNISPIITDGTTLKYGRTGYAYTHQFTVTGGSGSGLFSLEVQGNLPANSLSNSGLLTIPTVGNTAYNFIVKWTDTDGRTFTKAFTIPVSAMAFMEFSFRRPLDIEFEETYSVFEAMSGAEDVAEDAPLKRIFNMNSSYLNLESERAALWDFLYEHRLRKPFLWHNRDRDQILTVKVIKLSGEKEMRRMGEFEFVLKEV